ncbi:hypothetical protein [Micromonospora endolithica]|uniref:Uncharacterized protein n=1 Tax=Micromonospora endolithica TaxID=230091 RepID=A0A3A9Z112_9ACTN|nr:hypothetical protein [Micromonospora endolithica]RKN41086.1 hypothetical protein D7223_25425 [Micromonospora endolithica]TWJ24311.1 hypothetical protein JD76_04460 [Micromonospora endolithica]
MTLNGNYGSALFVSVPTTDGLDAPGVSRDDSEEAMRRLRHPFAVSPAAPAGHPAAPGDRPTSHS